MQCFLELPDELILQILNYLGDFSFEPKKWDSVEIEDLPQNRTLIYFDFNNALHISYKQWLECYKYVINLILILSTSKNSNRVLINFINGQIKNDKLLYYYLKFNYMMGYSILYKFRKLYASINRFVNHCPICNKLRKECFICLRRNWSVTDSSEAFWIPPDNNYYIIYIQIKKLKMISLIE